MQVKEPQARTAVSPGSPTPVFIFHLPAPFCPHFIVHLQDFFFASLPAQTIPQFCDFSGPPFPVGM